jgi:hypothetical protein
VWPAVAVHAANNAVWVLTASLLPPALPPRVHLLLIAALLPAGVALAALVRRLHPHGVGWQVPEAPSN